MFPFFLVFLAIWQQFSTEYIQRKLLCDGKFLENRCVKAMPYVGASTNFIPVLSVFISRLG